MAITKSDPINAKEVADALNEKANSDHTHNDIYYTETEVNSLLSAKQPTDYADYDVYNGITSTVNTYTCKNLTQYKFLIIQGIMNETGATIVNTIFPVNHFRNGTNAYILNSSITTMNYWINISWSSATSFRINEIKNMSLFRIIGVK